MNWQERNQKNAHQDDDNARADRAAITIMLVAAAMVFVMFVVLELPR